MVISSVMLKIELYASKFVNPIIQLESRPRLKDVLNEKFYVGLVSLYSSVSCGFEWLCWISVSQFLVIVSYKFSFLFSGRTMSKFI